MYEPRRRSTRSGSGSGSGGVIGVLVAAFFWTTGGGAAAAAGASVIFGAGLFSRAATGTSGFSTLAVFFSALATTAASFLPYFTITSRRCFALRRSSLHCRYATTPCAPTLLAAAKIMLKRRPNENCVARITAATISAMITIREPVRLK